MRKVLIVEDDAVMQIIVTEIIESFGFQTVSCDDGEEAWKILQQDKEINVVITDWIMPRLTGIELCRRIRNTLSPNSQYIYTIILTSKGDKNAFIEGMEAGADDFLIKPFDSEELRIRLNVAKRILARERVLAEHNQYLQLAQEQTTQDLQFAARMQRSLLPKVGLVGNNARFEWLFHPAKNVSGDCFNFFELNAEYIGFYQLDVIGHDMSAALLSFSLYHYLKQPCLLLSENQPTSPALVLQQLTQSFQMHTHENLRIAVLYGYMHKHTGDLCYARAGHFSPILT